MATHPRVESAGMPDDVPDEMVAELKKEIARNVEATKLVKQREVEATHARDKAADSQRRMQMMMDKYEEMKHKLEWTRLTLAETHSRLEKHNNSRSERLRQSVMELKEKAEVTAQRLHQRANGGNPEGAEALPEDDPVTPTNTQTDSLGGLGALGGMGDMGGLTDAERMLLQLCQEQRKTDVIVEEPPKEEPADRLRNASRDYAATVEALQKKLSSSSKKSAETKEVPAKEVPATEAPAEVSAESAIKESCEEVMCASQTEKKEEENTTPVVSAAAEIEPAQITESVPAEPTAAEAALLVGPVESVQEESAPVKSAPAEIAPAETAPAEISPAKSSVADSTHVPSASAAVEESQDCVVQALESKLKLVDADAIKMDLNVEMVAQVEAKVASVRETLGEMAMSEQYMRTKRAQLLARTREREAQLAMQLATEKEKEAAEMRQKVKQMMLMLDARRNQLRATVDVLQKKTGVVEKVNKILDQKERKANHVEKQRDECLAFDKKPKKN